MLNVQLIKKTKRAPGHTGKDVGDAYGMTKGVLPANLCMNSV